jgi:hypothetical protein
MDRLALAAEGQTIPSLKAIYQNHNYKVLDAYNIV